MKNETSKPNIPPPLPDYGIDTVFAFITYVACIAFACASPDPLYSNKINMHVRPDATTEIPKIINQIGVSTIPQIVETRFIASTQSVESCL
jgi:hypothetical protein